MLSRNCTMVADIYCSRRGTCGGVRVDDIPPWWWSCGRPERPWWTHTNSYQHIMTVKKWEPLSLSSLSHTHTTQCELVALPFAFLFAPLTTGPSLSLRLTYIHQPKIQLGLSTLISTQLLHPDYLCSKGRTVLKCSSSFHNFPCAICTDIWFFQVNSGLTYLIRRGARLSAVHQSYLKRHWHGWAFVATAN